MNETERWVAMLTDPGNAGPAKSQMIGVCMRLVAKVLRASLGELHESAAISLDSGAESLDGASERGAMKDWQLHALGFFTRAVLLVFAALGDRSAAAEVGCHAGGRAGSICARSSALLVLRNERRSRKEK